VSTRAAGFVIPRLPAVFGAVAGRITNAGRRRCVDVSLAATTGAARPFVAVLAATKAADAATTYLGVEVVAGVHEANPVVAGVLAAHGTVPGLAAVTAAVVCAVALVTETAVAAAARYADASPQSQFAVRLVGYGLPSAVNVAVSVRNAAVLAGL